MRLTYTAVDATDADYEARAQIANAGDVESDVPWTVGDLRAADAQHKPGTFCWRKFVVLDGKRIGTASCVEEADDEIVGNHAIRARLLPEYRDLGLETPIFDHLLEVSKCGGGLVATVWEREDRKSSIDAVRQMGFQCVKRDSMPQIDLRDFDAAGFAAALRAVESQGIALKSISELIAGGVDWVPSCYELCRELVLEVPALGHLRTCGIEKFREQIDSAWWFPEGWIVALDGERWVGQSELQPYPEKRDVAVTVLTGVVATYRRRGIATAMKVAALERAKQADVRFVHADNVADSPMLRLNRRLGFKERSVWLTFRKTL
jgi:GNAT superfamily N-acetyltransferase